MSHEDRNAIVQHVDTLRDGIASNRGPDEATLKRLADAGLSLLETFLCDVNRIADAAARSTIIASKDLHRKKGDAK